MSRSSMSGSPRSIRALSLLTLFCTVLATLSETSFWNTYSTAKTKKATPARLPLPRTLSLMRETRPLDFLKAYSVSLDDCADSSSELRRKIRRTRGMNDAL